MYQPQKWSFLIDSSHIHWQVLENFIKNICLEFLPFPEFELPNLRNSLSSFSVHLLTLRWIKYWNTYWDNFPRCSPIPNLIMKRISPQSWWSLFTSKKYSWVVLEIFMGSFFITLFSVDYLSFFWLTLPMLSLLLILTAYRVGRYIPGIVYW